MQLFKRRDDQHRPPEAGPAATAEEADFVITRLLAEWELRVRRARLEGSDGTPAQASPTGRAGALDARDHVIQRLAALGPAALEPLLRRLRPDEHNALEIGRAALAARALGRLGDVRAVPLLLETLRDQRDVLTPVRVAAATALGEVKAEAAATLYGRALGSQSSDGWQTETEWLGALRLATLAEALIGALRDPWAEVRAAAADALIDLCLAESPLALPAAGAEQPGASAGGAEALLEERGALQSAVAPLLEALKDEYAAVRLHAAAALGWLGDPRAAAPLIACLQDADESCRGAAAQALGMLHAPMALKPLARAMGDSSPTVRQQVAEALGALGDPIAADLLLDVLHDAEEPLAVRTAAACALGELHSPSALPALQGYLGAREPALRMAAIEALGRLGFGRAYRLLTPFLWRDPDRAVRHAAARALARLAQARPRRARWRLRLALRVARQTRKEALLILEQDARRER